MTPTREVKPALEVAAAARSPADLPAALGSRLLLELGLKPVIRELHDEALADAAEARWRRAGMATAMAAPVLQHTATSAKAIERSSEEIYTYRPLETHPAVERALALGGPLAERVLLHPESRVHRWLCARLGANHRPTRMVDEARGDSDQARATRSRRALYIGRDPGLVERCRDADGMGDGVEDAALMGELLGYPACCVRAFAALDVRYPNRLPISAAAVRTRRFEPLLNNLSLRRFTFVAHFPCRFDCAASLEQARAVAGAMNTVNPGVVRAVGEILAKPRLYRSDRDQAVLRGARRTGDRLSYEALESLDTAWPGRGDPSNFDWSSIAPRAGGTLRVQTAGETLVLPFGVG